MRVNKAELIYNLQKSVGYFFKNEGLLTESLTHSSYSYEKGLDYDYERLEFLGDAVLEMIVSEYIVSAYPSFNEGSMSALRAYVVNENSLSSAAISIGMEHCVYLGKGETAAGGIKKSILADILEAVIAAVYLDGGYAAAKCAVMGLLKESMEKAAFRGDFIDAKSEVQRICQQYFNKTPEYTLISETGPDHSKNYIVETDMCGLSYGRGEGPSKKKAEKAAAVRALKSYLDKKNSG